VTVEIYVVGYPFSTWKVCVFVYGENANVDANVDANVPQLTTET
jgi:hypothetical protein